MKLDVATIADIARRAGFAGDAVTTATAIAVGTSGGLTHYDHAVGAPGVGRYKGLWGVDVDRWPDYAGHDHADPYVNARAAHELTVSHHGFDWSPVYRSRWHEGFVDLAATHSTRVPGQQRAETRWPIGTAQHTITDSLARVHAAIAAGAGRPTKRGQWWRAPTQ